MTPEQLVREALEAMHFAYVPYSGFTVGAALLTTAIKPNRHADSSDKQYECRRSQPSKHKHHANAHSDDRKQQQTAPASTRTIYGRLSASPHRRATPIIFEHYSAIAC